MRIKRMIALAFVSLAVLSGAAACGDDNEGEAAEAKKYCTEELGLDDDTCGCVADAISDDYSTDEFNEAAQDGSLAVAAEGYAADCGGGDESTDDGSEDEEPAEDEELEEEE